MLSGITVVLVALAMLSTAAWSYIEHYQLFYDAIFGRFGVATLLVTAPSNFDVIALATFNSTLFYYAMIIIAAIIIAILVFELLQGLSNFSGAGRLAWQTLHTPGQLAEVIGRLAVRIASIIAWGFYTLLFVHILFPFCTLFLQQGLDAANMANPDPFASLNILWALALLAVFLHVHIIFARLCLLRLRIFGGFIELE